MLQAADNERRQTLSDLGDFDVSVSSIDEEDVGRALSGEILKRLRDAGLPAHSLKGYRGDRPLLSLCGATAELTEKVFVPRLRRHLYSTTWRLFDGIDIPRGSSTQRVRQAAQLFILDYQSVNRRGR